MCVALLNSQRRFIEIRFMRGASAFIDGCGFRIPLENEYGEDEGEIVTAYAVDSIKPEEERLWPGVS